MCQGVQAGLPQTSSPSLDLAGGGGEAEGGRGQAGLALAPGVVAVAMLGMYL